METETIDHHRRRLFGATAMTIAAAQLGLVGRADAQAPARLGTDASFAALKQADAGLLSVGYAEAGPSNGPAAILLHGWPYDIHSYVEVAPMLASAGYRVIVPHLRGYGTTRFLSNETVRNGQQSAFAADIIALMDALGIPRAVVAGYDWGARTANIMAALWPERCKALVSVSGYLIGSPEANKAPLPPKAELAWWYQFYFATSRGRAGYEKYRKDFAKLIWQTASPKWEFGDAVFDRSAAAFDNPDHVSIVIHNYRWRLGLAQGERQYDALEQRLAEAPAITVPTITLEGDANGAPHPEPASYARQFAGKYAHRLIKGGIGHNLPQEAHASSPKRSPTWTLADPPINRPLTLTEDHMQSRRSLVPRLLAGAALAGGWLPAARSAAQPGRRPPAPEFTGIDGWLNTPGPLSLAGLRGKVVLVNFWTYSCINCRRTVPYLNRWQAEYGTQGLQVVGVHTPEFGFERTRRNVAESVREFGILYPVGQDNAFRTWRAWGNRAWPTFYLLDRDDQVVLLREGEGHARELEGAIRGLLGLAPSSAAAGPGDDPDLSKIRTPEIYFGSLHPTPQDQAQSPRPGEAAYAFPQAAGPKPNEYQLDGIWVRDAEALVLRSPRGGLRVRFSAAKLHLVAAAPESAALRVRVDGSAPQTIEVGQPTLYTLLDGETYSEHLLEFEAGTPGLSLFSATFG